MATRWISFVVNGRPSNRLREDDDQLEAESKRLGPGQHHARLGEHLLDLSSPATCARAPVRRSRHGALCSPVVRAVQRLQPYQNSSAVRPATMPNGRGQPGPENRLRREEEVGAERRANGASERPAQRRITPRADACVVALLKQRCWIDGRDQKGDRQGDEPSVATQTTRL